MIGQIITINIPISHIKHEHTENYFRLSTLDIPLEDNLTLAKQDKIHDQGKKYKNRPKIMNNNLITHSFPFGPLSASQHLPEYPLIQNRHSFTTPQDQNLLQQKINKIRGLSLRNLIPIESTQQTQQWITIFYQHMPNTLDSLIDHSHPQTLKLLHRQFIELSIGLAKAGVTTTFNPAHCGALLQDEETVVKYYLPPQDVELSTDREEIERCVEIFSLQAMNFLKNTTEKKRRSALTNSSSQSILLSRSGDLKCWKTDNQDTRLSESKSSVNSLRLNKNNGGKEAQMRKLSYLTRQLSQISARHQAKKTHSHNGSHYQFNRSSQTHKFCESITTRLSDNSSLQKLYPAHQIQKYSIISSLKSRSKRAQQQLSSVKERMQGYKQLYDFLKNLRRN